MQNKKQRGTSQYKYVSLATKWGRKMWRARVSTDSWGSFYATEREAAKAVDMELIRMGREPVNILKPAVTDGKANKSQVA